MSCMIDAHAHLHEIEDVEAALRRAAAAGIERIIPVGTDLAANETTLALGRTFPSKSSWTCPWMCI